MTLLLLVIPWHELLVHLWRPLGAWDDAVIVWLVGALVVRSRHGRLDLRLLWPLLGLYAAGLLSVVCSREPLWALRDALEYTVVALAAAQIERDRIAPLLRRLVIVGGLAAAFGIVSFATFRAVGGGLQLRPPVPSGMLSIMTWPYYCGVYPRGDHLVGPFLNDLYFGVWLAALLAMAWAVWRRGDVAVAASTLLVLLAAAWTLERTTLLCMLVSVGFLAVRASPRLMLAAVATVTAALPLIRPYDRVRFHDITEGNDGRLAMLTRAWETLRDGPFCGHGPRTIRLSDCQYAKWIYETGWPGLLALTWLMATVLAPALRPSATRLTIGLGGAVLALAAGGLTSELWEVPQTACTLWASAGLLAASCGQDSPPRD